MGRQAAVLLGVALCIAAAGFVAVPARADDVPFEWNGNGSFKGIAKLENGHLSGDFRANAGAASISGDIAGGKVSVSISGNLGAKPGDCSGNGSAVLAPGPVNVQMSVNCHHSWSGTLVLHLPSSAGGPAGQANSAQYAIDPIDETYVAVQPAKVRERPDALSARIKTIGVGQKITVVGRVKGQDWYLVSENDQPLGYVIVGNLLPESQLASGGAVSAPSGGQPGAPTDIANLDFGRYEALVIGNNTYRNGLRPLKTAIADARAVAQALQSQYGFKVTLLVDATRAQILAALTKLRLSLTWDDNLLIYYAGHGSFDQAGDQGYWLPVDAVPQDPTNWVSNADITTMLKAIPARHVMVVADSCYSGSLTREAEVDIRDANYLGRIVQKRARTVLTSGGLEPVADAGSGGHSIFAAAFLVALQGNTGIMDAETFFEKIRKPVVLAGSQTPEYSNLRSAGHDGGDFIFVRKP
jgi:hypothetical protein